MLLGRPMNVSFIDDNICGSSRPFSKRSVIWLQEKMGINSILSLTESDIQKLIPENINYKHVPIKNHVAPTVPELEECVNFLFSESARGRKVDVHCAAGLGRTGTVLAAYLVAKYDMAAPEAIKRVRALRRGSIEKNQQEVVEEFAKRVEAGRGKKGSDARKAS
jgi:atypical dual specificity phosphatase